LKSIPKKNVGLYKEESFTPEQIEKIKAACELDYIIYNRGVELFKERCAKHSILNIHDSREGYSEVRA